MTTDESMALCRTSAASRDAARQDIARCLRVAAKPQSETLADRELPSCREAE